MVNMKCKQCGVKAEFGMNKELGFCETCGSTEWVNEYELDNMYLTVMCWCDDTGIAKPMKPVDDASGKFKCLKCKIVVSAKVFRDDVVYENEKFNNKLMRIYEG